MPEPLTIEEFAGKFKTQFPQFAGADDAELTRKILERRPDLIQFIKTSEPARPMKSEPGYAESAWQHLKNVGKNITVGMYEESKVRPGEGVPPEAVGVPMIGSFVANTIDDFWEGLKAGYQARLKARAEGQGIAGQTLATAENYPIIGPLVQGIEKSFSAKDLAEPWYKPVLPPEALGNVVEATGYYAAPSVIKKTGGAIVKGATKVMEKGPELLRQGAEIIAGTTPERTTEPLVEEFKKASTEATEKQAAETAATEQSNRAAIEKHQTAKREAFQKQQAQDAEFALKEQEVAEQNAREQARVDELNEAARETESRRGELARNLQEGSRSVGEAVKELDSQVREQGNAKYEAVRAKVADDPGVPLADLSREARIAEGKIKGSPENIKQFRDLIRKAPEAEGVETSAGFTKPGDPLYDQLVSEGAINEGGTLAFDDLQGYSTELGMKLAKGGLPGDVYQAMKYLKDKIDGAKRTIAERNGVGDSLKEADGFWRNYMETFYDKPSAVAAVLDRVGKLDPEYYSEPFVKGKSAKTGIEKLRQFSPELATQVENLRNTNVEYEGLPKAAKEAVAKVKAAPEPPSPVEQPAKPELKSPKQIEQPQAPTLEDVSERKREVLRQEARDIGRLSKWDAGIIAASVIAPFFGHWGLATLAAEPAFFAVRKAIGKALVQPKVMEWLAKPTQADLNMLAKLPDAGQAEVRSNMNQFVSQQRAAGKPIKISSEVANFLAGGAVQGGQETPTDLKQKGAAIIAP